MKTKKLLWTVVVAFMLSFLAMPAVAQIKVGVKGGIELESTSSKDVFKVDNLTSYYVGPAVEIMFPFTAVNFGLDAALLYSDSRMDLQGATESISNRHLVLPLNAKIRFGLGSQLLKMYVTAGPYTGYLISDEKISFSGIGEDVKSKKFAAGLNAGAGFELFKMVQLGINYRLKFTDDFSSGTKSLKDALNDNKGVLSISAALFF